MMRMNKLKEEEREIGRQMEIACLDGSWMDGKREREKVQSDQNVVTKSILWKRKLQVIY